jgi:hypothetical protein
VNKSYFKVSYTTLCGPVFGSQGRAVEFIVACIMSCHRLTNPIYSKYFSISRLQLFWKLHITLLCTCAWYLYEQMYFTQDHYMHLLVKNILNLIHYYQRQEGIITAICFVYAIIGSEMLCFRFR